MTLTERAYDFSVRVAECVKFLKADEKHFSLSDKLLDCGLNAGLAARNGKQKEAAAFVEQADYILEMAARSGYLTEIQTKTIRADARKLLEELHSPRRLSNMKEEGQ